jgi:hypothetical protein
VRRTTATTTTATTVGDEEMMMQTRIVFCGHAVFSFSESEQYGTTTMMTMTKTGSDGDGGESGSGDGRVRRMRGALAEDAEHLTFATGGEGEKDPASAWARFRTRHRRSGDGEAGIGYSDDARLEVELDGVWYEMTTDKVIRVVKSFGFDDIGAEREDSETGEIDVVLTENDRDSPDFLSIVFPHVTMTVFNNAAEWDTAGVDVASTSFVRGHLNALLAVLKNPAFRKTVNPSASAKLKRKASPPGDNRRQRQMKAFTSARKNCDEFLRAFDEALNEGDISKVWLKCPPDVIRKLRDTHDENSLESTIEAR